MSDNEAWTPEDNEHITMWIAGNPNTARASGIQRAMHELWRLQGAVAALAAENERMKAALTDVLACVSGGRLASIGSVDNVRCPQIRVETIDRWRAALTSSAEPTDGAN